MLLFHEFNREKKLFINKLLLIFNYLIFPV